MKSNDKASLRRYRPLALLLCMLQLFLLIACQPATEEPDNPSKDEGEVIDLGALNADGTALAYRVLRSDYSEKAETNLSVRLRDAMKTVFGKEVDIRTDYDDKDDNAAIKEIVIGKTNRAMSFDYPTAEDTWCIRAEENKIFICGQSFGALEEAVNTFISEILGYRSADDFTAKTELKMDVNYTKDGKYLDPEKIPDDGNPKVLYGLSQAQADEYFADILNGIFTGKTKETVDDKTVMGKGFNMHFPDMLYIDGEYWAYYICYRTETGKGGVGLAKSTDGVNFKDYGCVIQPGEDYDANGTYFAGVWRDTDGIFYLVYECKGLEDTEYGTLENVALATSVDGVNWEKEGVLLFKDKKLSWQTANVGTPDLYKAGDQWYVFFHGFDYETCQIGVATGEDIFNVQMLKEPIIPTEPDTLHSGTTGRRDVIYVGGYYYMVYEVSTEQPYGEAYWSHQFARSTDLIHWETIDEPLVRRLNASGEPVKGMGYDGPCWCIVGKHIYVYFRAGGGTMRAELTLGE